MAFRTVAALSTVMVVSACVAIDKSELVPFSAAGAVHGITVTEAECNSTKDTVWVVVDDKGECIRYFKSGVLPESNEIVYIWFQGDQVQQAYGSRYVSEKYKRLSDEISQQNQANYRTRYLGRPYIQISRLGVFGSSGYAMHRRSKMEAAYMKGALDQIKERFSIRQFVLAGHSGGGHVVASLLPNRDDILCAVPVAAPLLTKQRLDFLKIGIHHFEISRDEMYDPIEYVDEVSRDGVKAVYTVSDPQDQVVPEWIQRDYIRALQARGINAHYLPANSKEDKRRHGFGYEILEIALECEKNFKNPEKMRRFVERRFNHEG